MKVAGCKVLVVGGAKGIGRAVCELLAGKGAQIYIGDILTDVGHETVKAINEIHGRKAAHFTTCDVRNITQIKDMVAAAVLELGSLNVVINMVGIFAESNPDLCIDVNLSGTIRVTEEALKVMGRDCGGQGGVIINTASMAGLIPHDIVPVYSATKLGVVGYTRSMAGPDLFINHGVRLNMVCPFGVDTDIFRGNPDVRLRDKVKQLVTFLEETSTLLKPSTVAEAYLQIIEEDSLNGEALRVSHAKGIEVYKFDMDHPDQ